MLFPYLVLTQMTDKTSHLLPVAAENPEQAIAARICVERNEGGANILGVFGEKEIENAQGLLQEIKKEIDAAGVNAQPAGQADQGGD